MCVLCDIMLKKTSKLRYVLCVVSEEGCVCICMCACVCACACACVCICSSKKASNPALTRLKVKGWDMKTEFHPHGLSILCAHECKDIYFSDNNNKGKEVPSHGNGNDKNNNNAHSDADERSSDERSTDDSDDSDDDKEVVEANTVTVSESDDAADDMAHTGTGTQDNRAQSAAVAEEEECHANMEKYPILFVINHRLKQKADYVEVFRIVIESLSLSESAAQQAQQSNSDSAIASIPSRNAYLVYMYSLTRDTFRYVCVDAVLFENCHMYVCVCVCD